MKSMRKLLSPRVDNPHRASPAPCYISFKMCKGTKVIKMVETKKPTKTTPTSYLEKAKAAMKDARAASAGTAQEAKNKFVSKVAKLDDAWTEWNEKVRLPQKTIKNIRSVMRIGGFEFDESAMLEKVGGEAFQDLSTKLIEYWATIFGIIREWAVESDASYMPEAVVKTAYQKLQDDLTEAIFAGEPHQHILEAMALLKDREVPSKSKPAK